MQVRFCHNRSSWDEVKDQPLPGSMCDLIAQPIMAELDGFEVSRQPLEDRVNLYASGRGSFGLWPEREVSVLLSHGIADKGIRQAEAPDFDHVFAPGPLHQAQLLKAGCPASKIMVAGYTKLDPLFPFRRTRRRGRIRVLYAPTHGGGGDMTHMDDTVAPPLGSAHRSSWWHRDQIVDVLTDAGDEFAVTVAPHPRYTSGHKATFEQYRNADVVIADGGSTLWEAMILGIPLVIPTWLTHRGFSRSRQALETLVYHRRIGRHSERAEDLVPLIREAAGGQTDAERELADEVLPVELREVAGKLHAEAIASWV